MWENNLDADNPAGQMSQQATTVRLSKKRIWMIIPPGFRWSIAVYMIFQGIDYRLG